MEIIIHKVNTIKKLKRLDLNYGAEIDVRSWGSKLVLNHEPFEDGESLVDYLDTYRHGTLILNIKEAGIENKVLKLINDRDNIKNYFLLDVEFPYLYEATKKRVKNVAIRFSEKEDIATVNNFTNQVDWVWIDTVTKFPVNEKNLKYLNYFKKCLVCPERWGRPFDISSYKKIIKMLDIKLDAVMTSTSHAKYWV